MTPQHCNVCQEFAWPSRCSGAVVCYFNKIHPQFTDCPTRSTWWGYIHSAVVVYMCSLHEREPNDQTSDIGSHSAHTDCICNSRCWEMYGHPCLRQCPHHHHSSHWLPELFHQSFHWDCMLTTFYQKL